MASQALDVSNVLSADIAILESDCFVTASTMPIWLVDMSWHLITRAVHTSFRKQRESVRAISEPCPLDDLTHL